MSSWTENFQKGVDMATQATVLDTQANYAAALRLYTQACDWILLALKWIPPNIPEATKDSIRLRMREYLSRAEILKRIVVAEAGVEDGQGGVGTSKVAPAAASSPQYSSSSSSSSVGGQNNSQSDVVGGGARNKAIRDSFVPAGQLNIRWSDIAGHEECKVKLKQAVIVPIKQPQVWSMGQAAKGVLLYGPPGTGKTELAKALATESGCSFINITQSTLADKYFGESEKIVAALFAEAANAAPCIIFIDEIDSVLKERSASSGNVDHGDGAKTEFLIRWDGMQSRSGVIVMGATNLPWLIDGAARRRFTHRVYIPLPDKTDRAKIFEIQVRRQGPCDLTFSSAEYAKLADLTEGYSGSDIRAVVQCALAKGIEFSLKATHFCRYKSDAEGKEYYGPALPSDEGAIKMTFDEVPEGCLASVAPVFDDFLQAVQQTPKSVSQKDLANHVQFTELYGSQG